MTEENYRAQQEELKKGLERISNAFSELSLVMDEMALKIKNSLESEDKNK